MKEEMNTGIVVLLILFFTTVGFFTGYIIKEENIDKKICLEKGGEYTSYNECWTKGSRIHTGA